MDTSLELMDDWVCSGRGFKRYLNAGVTNGGEGRTTQDGSQVIHDTIGFA
uniref:Uncharacterized protein n=1 Tax=Arundo donax TaxID=35708 RepID=A0A0A9BYH6_ARUDO